MEIKERLAKLAEVITKYRYAAVILIIGIVLMMMPAGTASDTQPQEENQTKTEEASAEEKLSNILSKIQGAGKVEVILSFASGEETQYYENAQTDGDSNRADAVIITDSDKNQSALVSRIDPPEYLGAVVVCQGADSAAIRLAIVDAVSKYTGLGADRISVLKMK